MEIKQLVEALVNASNFIPIAAEATGNGEEPKYDSFVSGASAVIGALLSEIESAHPEIDRGSLADQYEALLAGEDV